MHVCYLLTTYLVTLPTPGAPAPELGEAQSYAKVTSGSGQGGLENAASRALLAPATPVHSPQSNPPGAIGRWLHISTIQSGASVSDSLAARAHTAQLVGEIDC